jgi:HSP20 family protein
MTVESTVAKPSESVGKPTEATHGTWTYRPNVDILESDNELTLRVDIPGAQGDGIDVDFRDGTLSIHAKVTRRQTEAINYLLREYGVGDFYRAFTVSEVIDAANITAEYREGVLTLHLPKVSAVKPHKISVQTN